MKKRLFKFSIVLFPALAFIYFLTGCTQNDDLTHNSVDKEVKEKVAGLIKKMTLEEKVGQMNQITLDVFYESGSLDTGKLHKYVVDYGTGSILNTYASRALTLKEWRDLITIIQNYAMESRLKIPVLYGIDAIHGVTYLKGATLFPHNIAMAATRDTNLVRKAAKITAQGVRACGIRWNFDPVLGVGRNPLWSRFEETFGEDTYLVSQMGKAAISAYEEDGLDKTTAVASCMKHYLGYPVPASGKDRTPAYIPEIRLRQIFLPPFKDAVDAGASTVMINSGSINGIPVHANKYLLTDVLKNELGFKGLVVTDWEDIISLYKQHHIVKNNKEAVALAVNAGIDMSMVPHDLSFYNDLISAVKKGKVPMSRIDDAVSRILTLKYRLGLFDNPFPGTQTANYKEKKEYKNVAYSAAANAITLLKNDSLTRNAALPLSKDMKILIAGPGVNSKATLHGSWSYSWQSNDDAVYPKYILTIGKAFKEKLGKDKVINISPEHFQKVDEQQIKRLTRMSKSVDAIVLCLGENSYAESPGSIDDLTLPEDQIKLAEAAGKTGKPVILVLTEGRPRIISKIESLANGILLAYRPGNMGAQAIVDVIFGDINPSGVLPFSYPRNTGNIICYDMPVRTEKYYNPQWPFGYGLSYTNFSADDPVLSSDTISIGDDLKVGVTIHNTGKRDGKVAVDLFVRDSVASVVPPMKKLRRFKKVSIKAGESKNVSFTLNSNDLSFIGTGLKPVTEEGWFTVEVMGKKSDFYLKQH